MSEYPLYKKEAIDPLPPTPITPDAKALLMEAWGVPENWVRRLRSLAAKFRYNRCIEKTTIIAKNGAVFDRTSGTVAISDFYCGKSRTGECGSIALELLKEIVSPDYIGDLNAQRVNQQKKPLKSSLFCGLSKTHFNNRESNHSWLGLAQKDDPLGVSILIDASFQVISTLEESGYVMRSVYDDPSIINADPSKIHVGTYIEKNTGGFSAEFPHTVIIGCSQDKKVCYGLAFMKSSTTGNVRPTIVIHQEQGNLSNRPFVMIKEDETFRWAYSDDNLMLYQLEANELLKILQNMSITSLNK